MSEPELDPVPNDPPADSPADPPKDPPSETGDNNDPPSDFAWPEDWRNHLAGDDKDLLKDLNKFTDPAKVYKSYRDLNKKLSSGEYVKVLPENATDEEKAAWRKAQGIPESPDKYDVDLSKFTDDQKDYANKLIEHAHKEDLPPGKVQSILDFMLNSRTEAMDSLAEMDAQQSAEIEETLRDEFGKDYRVNMNIMSSMLDGQEEGFKNELLEARMGDGTMLKNNPAFIKFMVSQARQLNPVGAILPQGGSDPKGIDEEISERKELLKTDPQKYYGEKNQARMKELYQAKEKLK